VADFSSDLFFYRVPFFSLALHYCNWVSTEDGSLFGPDV
jgi:hypothetical protein